jgi:hypothetical protein
MYSRVLPSAWSASRTGKGPERHREVPELLLQDSCTFFSDFFDSLLMTIPRTPAQNSLELQAWDQQTFSHHRPGPPSTLSLKVTCVLEDSD